MSDFFTFEKEQPKPTITLDEGQFVATIPDALAFRNLLSVLNVVNNEPTIHSTSEGLSSKFMDGSHCCMVVFSYPKTALDEYIIKEDSSFCLDLGSLLKKNVFKDIKKDTGLKLSLVDKKVTFDFREKYSRKLQVESLEPSTVDVPLPKIHATVKAKIVLDDFLRVINNVEDLGNTIVVEANSNGIVFKNLSTDNGKFESVFEKGSEEVLMLETERSDTTYTVALSLAMLKPFILTLKKVTDLVTLEFDTDKPIKIIPQLFQGINLEYFQAPVYEK